MDQWHRQRYLSQPHRRRDISASRRAAIEIATVGLNLIRRSCPNQWLVRLSWMNWSFNVWYVSTKALWNKLQNSSGSHSLRNPVKARFLISSQPIPPAPTQRIWQFWTFSTTSSPSVAFIPKRTLFTDMLFQKDKRSRRKDGAVVATMM